MWQKSIQLFLITFLASAVFLAASAQQEAQGLKVHFSFIKSHSIIRDLRRESTTFDDFDLDEIAFVIIDSSGFLPREIYSAGYYLDPDDPKSWKPGEKIEIPLEIHDRMLDKFVVDFHPLDLKWQNPDIPEAFFHADIYPVIPRFEYERLYVLLVGETVEEVAPFNSIQSEEILEEINEQDRIVSERRDSLSAQPKNRTKQEDYERALWTLFELTRDFYSKYNTKSPYMKAVTSPGRSVPDEFLDPRVMVKNTHYFLNHWKSDSLFVPAEFPGWFWDGRHCQLEESDREGIPIRLFGLYIPVFEEFGCNTDYQELIEHETFTAIQLYHVSPGNPKKVHPDKHRVAVLFPKFGRVEDDRIEFELRDWFEVFNQRFEMINDFNFQVSYRRHGQEKPADNGWYKWLKDKKLYRLLYEKEILVGTRYGLLDDPADKSLYPSHRFYQLPRKEFFPYEFRILGTTFPKESPDGSETLVFRWQLKPTDNRKLLELCSFNHKALSAGNVIIDFKPFNKEANSDRMQILVFQGYWQRDRQRLYSFDFRNNRPQEYTDFYQFYNNPGKGDYIFIREDDLIVDHESEGNAQTPQEYSSRGRLEYGTIIVNMLDFNYAKLDSIVKGELEY